MNIHWQMLLGFAVILLIPLYGSVSERLRYNNGVCKETGEPWEYFDTDSQGSRGYRSDDYICWVSWPGIDGR